MTICATTSERGPAAVTIAARPLSADDSLRQSDGERVELDRGIIVREVPMPEARHGKICFQVARILGGAINESDLGRVLINDTWTKTRTTPDSVRGPDFMFVSHDRQARREQPSGPLTVSPKLVVEVRTPSDSWSGLLTKATEYLHAGVKVVPLLDPLVMSVTVCREQRPSETFLDSQALVLPDVLPGFAWPVASMFTLSLRGAACPFRSP